jgi:formylglycine-generating enzyme required for sulfatase activity
MAKASARVLRGGSWNNNGRNCRSANRNMNEPDNRNHNNGFRLAAAPTGTDVPQEPAGLPSRLFGGQMTVETSGVSSDAKAPEAPVVVWSSPPMNDPKKRNQLFLLSQRLAELVSVEDEWRRKLEVCGKADDDEPVAPGRRESQENPWKEVDRPAIINHAAGPKPWHRVMLVCDAGLGKSTNMAWLQAAIAADATSRRLPVLLQLEDASHERILLAASKASDSLFEWLIADIKTQVGGDSRWHARALERMLADGRITFLIDGLDHALSGQNEIVQALHQLFGKTWHHCPVWLSGRPYAFKECWSLVKDPAWHVVKVHGLSSADAGFYFSREVEPQLEKPTHSWLEAVSEEGRQLLATPRFLHLVSGSMRKTVNEAKRVGANSFEAVRRLKLSTRADLYNLAYCEPGEFVDPATKIAGEDSAVNSRGLIAQGLKAFLPARNRNLKYPGLPEGVALDDQNYGEAVENVRALLAAMAFEMYAHPDKLQLSDDAAQSPATEAKPLEPFTRTISPTPASIYRSYKNAVARRLTDAGALTFPDLNIDDEINLLGKMNVGAVDFLLFRNLSLQGLRWHDRTVQAFFAAHWAMKYGSDDDLRLLRKWIVDSNGKRLAGFDEFWQFAAEMPDHLVDRNRWLSVFRDCYKPPAQLTGWHDWVQWHRRMVYHSFALMEKRSPMTIDAWRAKTAEQAAIVAEIEAGWKDIAAGRCQYGAEPAENRPGRAIQVPAFRMHQWPVINRWYEEFDPAHRANRWKNEWNDQEHSLASAVGREGEDWCPVVNVTWYDTWCFAAWLGNEIHLPSEVQWEHACRKGTAWDYYFDGGENELENHAWFGTNSQGHTHPMPPEGSPEHRNENGLYDLLGNVWEWCADRYDAGASARVLRGGSWGSGGWDCRSADRGRNVPGYRVRGCGFRLAAVPALEPSGVKAGKSVGDVAASGVESKRVERA